MTTSDLAAHTVQSIRKDVRFHKISGMAIVDTDSPETLIQDIPVVADAKSVIPYLTRAWVDEVFFCVPPELAVCDHLLSSVINMGIRVHQWLPDSTTINHSKVEKIGDLSFHTISVSSISSFGALIKRFLDIIGGILGSILALFIMAILAIPLKKQSPGPVLYKAERVGLNGRRFRMYKIRSMCVDADQQKPALMKDNLVKDGRLFRLEWDPRIIGNQTLPDGSHRTGIGAFIRNSFIDEFPQFFNVLKGDMSLVGTRPPTPDEWEKYEPHHRARMCVKPGITGMWQASGGSQTIDFEQVVQLDMEYITNWSILLDIKLIWKTLVKMINKIWPV